jgi:hypothetical protein
MNIEAAHGAFSLVNFVAFLWDGRYVLVPIIVAGVPMRTYRWGTADIEQL